MSGKRVLIANRGEIALRIIRAVRELGHIPIAIYSKADRNSLHVAKSDEAYCVGDPPSVHSYLNTESVMKAATELKVDAIHPGYGFLSENADFAKAVEAAGIKWIGPSAEVISTMGNKVAARNTMEKAGVPLTPGTKEGITDEKKALKLAEEIGFPVMIKAVAGGGGRGMRLVEKKETFLNLFNRASSEASKAFGDGRLYIERFITSPHHIEVQVIADTHGNVCHLFERECSVQRRHQKVIEESPSPFISQETREKICQTAVEATRNIGYVNAGTYEFLVDDKQNFYFMEMNTRLQVEHPVTEMTTGIDLVKEQIRIAFGEKLSFTQEQVVSNGHAIEFRIYAEDPAKFLPQAGLLTGIRFPRGPWIRIDSHIFRGYEIPVFYDSMIAKLTVWGRNREEAISRARVVVSDTVLNGIQTNLPLHLQILDHPKFREGDYNTHFIGEDFNFKKIDPPPERLKMALIAVAVSAFNREFKGGGKGDTENSRWRSVGRTEALR